MTDETKEPGMEREGQISEDIAREYVDELREGRRELMADPEFLSLVVGQALFMSEVAKLRAEDPNNTHPTFGKQYAQKGHEESERRASFFLDLLKGEDLANAISRYGSEAIAWIKHNTANTGEMLLMTRKGQSNMYKGYTGIIGGVQIKFNRDHKDKPGDVKLKKEVEVARERALERARKLDEELGQK